jgi:hypothetical protein
VFGILVPVKVNIQGHVLRLNFKVEICGLYLNISDKGQG